MRILFVVYDNESSQNLMPLGVLYIAAYLRKHGYSDIHFYNQDVYHYPESHLTEYLSKNKKALKNPEIWNTELQKYFVNTKQCLNTSRCY